MTPTKQLQAKHFHQPDETRKFENGWIDIIDLGGGNTIGLGNFRPGWKWSEHVKPLAKTESCQSHHVGYVISGRMHVAMDDGMEIDLEPGMAIDIPPGHDAWIVGDEPCKLVDFMGMANYAMSGSSTIARQSTPSHARTQSHRTRVAEPAGVGRRGRSYGRKKTTSSRRSSSKR